MPRAPNSEPARAAVLVTIESTNGTHVASTLTDEFGRYYFTSNAHGLLPVADYVLVVDRSQVRRRIDA